MALGALIGAAAIFTAGGALGITAGWGKVAGKMVASIGLKGKIGTIVTGAVQQAGWGAMTGAVMSKAGGGSFWQGATSGAKLGAISGAATGLFKPGWVGGGNKVKAPDVQKAVADAHAGVGADPGLQDALGITRTGMTQTSAPVSSAVPGVGRAAGGAGGAKAVMGKVGAKLGKIATNETMLANLGLGVGSALLGGDDEQAELEREKWEQARNAREGVSLLYPGRYWG